MLLGGTDSLAGMFGERGWRVLGRIQRGCWEYMEMGADASHWHYLFVSFESRPRDVEQTGDIFDRVIVHCLSSP